MTWLVGHDQAERALLQAWASDRLHHAWLISGPEGIGKATLAVRFARFLLSDRAQSSRTEPVQNLDVPDDDTAASLIAAGSHPGLRVLTREVNDRGKLATAITVDQVRSLYGFLGGTAFVDGGWRVVIVDPADALNRHAANALLKMLEEPPAQVMFLLVSHAPGRLLATVRSRCRLVPLMPLSSADTQSVLARVVPDASQAELERLSEIAVGSPGRAVAFAGLDIATLESSLDALERAGERWQGKAAALADSLAGVAQGARFEAFIVLLQRRVLAHAKAASAERLAPWMELWDKAARLARQAGPLALDPRLVVWSLCAGLAKANAPKAS